MRIGRATPEAVSYIKKTQAHRKNMAAKKTAKKKTQSKKKTSKKNVAKKKKAMARVR